MTDFNAALFNKPRVLHLSLREQMTQTERSLKACLEAMKRAYDVLWQAQNEHQYVEGKMNQLAKSKAGSISAEMSEYKKQRAQLEYDLRYLRNNLEKNKPQEVVDRLKNHLEQLNAQEQPRQNELGADIIPATSQT